MTLATIIRKTGLHKPLLVATTAFAAACGGDGGNKCSPTDPTCNPPPVDNPPSLAVAAATSIREGEPYSLTATGSDDKGLSKLVVYWTPNDSTVENLSGTSLSQTLQHTYNTAGQQTIRVMLEDSKGQRTPRTHPITVQPAPRSMFIDLDAKLYFEQDANASLVGRARNATTGQEVALTNNNGRLQGELQYDPSQQIQLRFDDPQHSELHRMKIDGTFHVTDYTDRAITLTARDTLRSTVETVDSAAYLQRMATQWGENAATMKVGVPQYFVLNMGRASCRYVNPEFQQGIACDHNNAPGGIPVDPSSEARYNEAIDEVIAPLNDPRVGGNPFDIRKINTDTMGVQQYLTKDGAGIWQPNDNVHYVTRIGWPHGETHRAQGSGVRVITASLVGTDMVRPSWVTNEILNRFGSVQESNPPICSIHDSEQVSLPACPVQGATILYQNDKTHLMIAAGYVARAQVQAGGGFNPRIVP